MKQLSLRIEGMSCASCSSSIERSMRKKKFIQTIEVDLVSSRALVVYDEECANQEDIINHINKLGYKASVFIDKDIDIKKSRKHIIAIVFAVILLAVSMINMVSPSENELLICIIEIVLLIPILYAGSNIYKKGTMSIIKLIPNMDSLVTLGSGAAIVYSIYMLILYLLGINKELLDNLYFESAGVIIAVIMLGKYIENKATDLAKSELNALTSMLPKKVIKNNNHTTTEIDIDEIQIGDVISIPRGSMVPIDGILIDEECILDTSTITGESRYRYKNTNDEILSGSINCGEQFLIQVTKNRKESTIEKIISMMTDIKKAPIARIADTISAYFVPIVIAISIIGSITWFINTGNVHYAFIVLTSTLLISCPCALGLATPLSILVATNKGSSKNIYFKNGESLEMLSKINTMVFDKTGTITDGKLVVSDFINKHYMDEKKLFAYVKAIESRSEHVIARAINDYVSNIDDIDTSLDVKEIQTSVGSGIQGIVDGKHVKIGNAKFVGCDKIDSKHTLAYVSINGILSGIFVITDSIRENAKQLIDNLNKLNIRSIILSGDDKECVSRVAKACGINEYHHSKLPHEKLDFISALQNKHNKVGFVGDGINDVLSLKKANVGISLSSANDIAIKQADILLLDCNLNSIYNAILLSKKTIKNIKENLGFAFIYNILAIPIALGIPHILGVNISLNPMLAGIAMGMSSISVVFNTLRLKRAI